MNEREEIQNTDAETSANGLASLVWMPTSRRRFLKLTGAGGASVAAIGLGARFTSALQSRQVYAANAEGVVLADPTRCVGCRRCELACTEFNEGKAAPEMARIKVNRNFSFGPEGVAGGFWDGPGRFGNQKIVQDTCKQCPHPVPCQLACPQGAIEVDGPVNARVVNQDKCVGCRICQRACPWGMTSFDEEIQKATKCHLCEGEPECVQACPASALSYIPWVDMTKDEPARFVVPGYISSPPDVQETCAQCH
ncbi:MAG: 4Fe-4S dicluster domain-containing protein [Anaerolineae bacterium]|jgi:Fe-S-cluster-containing dehydrogenase component